MWLAFPAVHDKSNAAKCRSLDVFIAVGLRPVDLEWGRRAPEAPSEEIASSETALPVAPDDLSFNVPVSTSTSDATGVQLFVRGTDNAIWHTWQKASYYASWAPWSLSAEASAITRRP